MSPECDLCGREMIFFQNICTKCFEDRPPDNKEFLEMFDRIADSLKEYIDVTNTITIDIPLLIEKVLNPEKKKWEERK